MKKITFFLALLGTTLLTSCSTEEMNTSNNEVENHKLEKCGFANRINRTTKITITDVTRGFYETIEIQGNQVAKNSSGIVPPTNYIMTYSKFNYLNYLFSTLNLSQIPSFAPPSKDYMFDGAQIETLEIFHNGVQYSSQPYDRGNPPAALKNFVNYVKSL